MNTERKAIYWQLATGAWGVFLLLAVHGSTIWMIVIALAGTLFCARFWWHWRARWNLERFQDRRVDRVARVPRVKTKPGKENSI